MTTFEFNGSNWHEFFAKYWNKQPVVIKKISPSYHLKTDELFKSLSETCDTFQRDNRTQIKLYVNNNQIIQDLYDSLPSAKLGNFVNHANLIKEKYRSETFTLYVNGLLSQHPNIWMRYYRFLREVFAELEINYQNIDFEVFAGRYQSTAGGVHQEACSNFHFLVHGAKTMRVWHPDMFSSHAFNTYQTSSERYLLCSDYQPYIDESIPLKGEAGDILYWPAGYWHVGESPQLSASVNLAMYMQENAVDFVIDHLKKYVANHNTIPQALPPTLSLLQQAMHAKSFQNEMLQTQLEKASSYGLEKIVKRSANKIDDDTIFSTSTKQSPIQIVESDENTILYGAFGHLFKMEKNQLLLNLLHFLNSSETSSLSEVKNSIQVDSNDLNNTSMIEKIISELYSIHWISTLKNSN